MRHTHIYTQADANSFFPVHPRHDTTWEQLLALTTTDGSFFLGALSKDSCWLRIIAVTEQASSHANQTSKAAGATTSASDNSNANSTTAPAPVPAITRRPQRSHFTPATALPVAGGHTRATSVSHYAPTNTASSPVVRGHTRATSAGWGSWSLWGRGRGAVAAAATAAANAISSPPDSYSPSASGSTLATPAGATTSRDAVVDAASARSVAPAAEGHSRGASAAAEAGGRDGYVYVDGPTSTVTAQAEESNSPTSGDPADGAGAGAVGVEFSAKGGLMAVALVDGTVLLTRVERYTSGVRYGAVRARERS